MQVFAWIGCGVRFGGSEIRVSGIAVVSGPGDVLNRKPWRRESSFLSTANSLRVERLSPDALPDMKRIDLHRSLRIRHTASVIMLQWMGGSRRKVTTTRRSTHNRQKQYFEQRKQRQLASRLECDDEGKHKQTKNYGNSASLDIASLANLATLTQECSYNDMTYENSTTCNRVEIASPKKSAGSTFPDDERSSQTKSLNKNNHEALRKDVPTDMQSSFFDFLGDYEFHDSSQGRSTHEAHVAFSVEGLGKIKTKTTISSPVQLKSPNIRLTSRGATIKSVPNGSPSGCMPNSCNLFDDFLSHKWKFCCNVEEKDYAFGHKTWDGRSSFLDNNAFDDKTYGVTWNSQTFSVDNCTHRDNTQENFDYNFEDTFLFDKRHVGEIHNNPNRISDLWQMDSPVSSLKPLPSENANDSKFLMSEDIRCLDPEVEIFNDPSWSSFHSEDSRKSMSFLSEESCSSSTVRDDHTKRPISDLFEDRSRNRNNGTKVHMNTMKNMTNISVTKAKSRKLDKVHEDDILKDVENIDSPNVIWVRDAQPLKGHAYVHSTREPLERSLSDDGCIPDIGQSGQHSSDKEFASFGCKLLSVEDICWPYPSTRTCPRVIFSPGKSQSNFMANDFFKAAENISKEQSADHPTLTEVQRTNTSCTLDCLDIEEISGIQPTGCNVSEGIKKDDIPEVDADLSSRSATSEGTCISSASAENVQRTNISLEGAKDEEISNVKVRRNVSNKTIEKYVKVIDIPEMRKSLDSAQVTLMEFMEIPPKLEICTRNTEHREKNL